MSTFNLIAHMTNTNLSNRIHFPSSAERRGLVRFSEGLSMIGSSITLAPIPTHTRFLVKGGAR